jgi:hypothetical protein
VIALPADSSVIRALAQPDFDPSAVAYARDSRLAGEYPGKAAAIDWIRDDPDAIELRVRAPAPAFVVVADTWLPGWSATLDGRSVTIARVDHLLRGFAVPAGEHRLAMRYRVPRWDALRAVSLAAWAAWLLAWAGAGAVVLRRRATGGAAGERSLTPAKDGS